MMVKKCICSSCVVISKGKTLLLLHKKLGVWLYPGGHVDPGEIPLEAAIRETREETGYRVKIIGKKKLGRIPYSLATEQPDPLSILYEHVPYRDGKHMHFDMIYLAAPVGKRGKVSEYESTKLRWVSEKELDSINTYPNVRSVLKYAFKAYSKR
jgi:8-oxo-dGTP diphosphatase